MDYTRIVLRLFHILGGVFWVGGTWMMSTYIGNSAKALGEDAAKFMQHFTLRSGFQIGITLASISAVLSGMWLYYLNFGDKVVLDTGAGLALSVGGTTGIIAFLIGALVIGRSTNKVRAIADQIGQAGGPPSEKQMQEMQALQLKIAGAGAIVSVLMVITLIGMTLSEYFAI